MKRSKFSLSHTKLMAMDMGNLIPIGLTEVLPGDTIQASTAALIRCSPLLSPVMHPVHVRIHHWYVPHRLIWDDFEKFITGGPDGLDATVFPTFNNSIQLNSLGDYYGLPISAAATQVFSALPMRGYAAIWNENYRDQDLQAELVISKASGPDTTTSRTLQNVAWEKDYFTSARPWEQKGPAITIPIGTSAPVYVDAIGGSAITTRAPGGSYTYMDTAGATLITTGSVGSISNSMKADLTNASAVTINVLREAFALQRFEEARARYGSRYTEYLRYLGVHSSDARLQRPEYLGGGKQTVQFSEVLQTGTPTAPATSPVGEMRGHGIGAMRSNRYRRFIEEHGYIHSFMSIRPKTMYMQGMARHWNRRTKEDFWQKELQHIGQQEILNKEVYIAHANPTGVFGYQDRYDEYRRSESGVASEFRNSTLNYWHLAREFSSDPALNAAFVSCVPTERVFAANTNKVMYAMISHSIQARRMVAKNADSFIF